MDSPRPEDQLLAEVAGLAVDEILALCYAFQNTPRRLRLYLDALRRRGGERAQFASCLLCFDLARQGDETAQREFAFLSDTIRALGENRALVESLVSDDEYLTFIWELLQAQLAELDPRFEGDDDITVVEAAAVVELELLSDDDFQAHELDIAVDDAGLWRRFDEAVEAFLGGTIGLPIYDPSAAFRLNNNKDVQRIEKFLQELDSLREFIPISRGFRAITLLFYGTHMRSRSVFGAVNTRKRLLLRDGLEEFMASGPQIAEIAGVLSPLHAGAEVWDKIGTLVYDYVAWLAESPDNLSLGLNAYDPIERITERMAQAGNRRAGHRDL